MIVKLYKYLKNNGIDVYFIGQHVGVCKNEYIVLKDDGGNNGLFTIDIIFYLPKNNFSKADTFKKEVKELLKKFNDIKYTGVETAMIIESEKEAITFSILYNVLKKVRG